MGCIPSVRRVWQIELSLRGAGDVERASSDVFLASEASVGGGHKTVFQKEHLVAQTTRKASCFTKRSLQT